MVAAANLRKRFLAMITALIGSPHQWLTAPLSDAVLSAFREAAIEAACVQEACKWAASFLGKIAVLLH